MKHNRAAARVPALVLALTLAFSLTSLPAWADFGTIYGEVNAEINPGPSVYVLETSNWENKYLASGGSYPAEGTPMVTYERTDPLTVTVNANIDSENFGICAYSDTGTVTVNAAEDAKTITSYSNGIYATGFGGTVTVNAPDVNVTAGAFGVNAHSDSNGSATVKAGNVTSTGSTGIYARGGTTYGPGTTKVTAKTVTAAGTGVEASSYYGGSTTVKVGTTDENGTFTGGTVTAGGTGIVANAKNNGRVEVKTGVITLTGEDNKKAVEAKITTGGSVDITAGDPASNGVSVQGSGDQGIIIRNSSGYETTVNADSVGTEANPVNGRGVDVTSTGAGSVTTVTVDSVIATAISGNVDGGVIAKSGDNDGSQTIVNAGNVTAAGDSSYGVYTGHSGTTVTVSGSVTVTGDNSKGVDALDGSTINAGSVIVSGDKSTGVLAFHGTANAGSVSVNGKNSIGVHASGGGTVTVNGSVTASGDDGIGIDAQGAGTTVTVDSVSASGYDSASIKASSGSTVNAGSVTASGLESYGVKADGTGTTVTVSDSVSASGGGSYGVYATGGSTVNVGSVTQTVRDGCGVFAKGTGTKVTVGSVTAEGIGVEAYNGSTINADSVTTTGGKGVVVYKGGTVNAGSVTVTSSEFDGFGIDVYGGGTVNAGSVTATGNYTRGVSVWGPDGATVNIKEDIKAGNGIRIDLFPDAKYTVTVAGDVAAADNGINVYKSGVTPGEGSVPGRAEVLIGGTLSGQYPVMLGEDADDGLILTVWKIETLENGKAVPFTGTWRSPDQGNVLTKPDKDPFDSNIRYIIRVQQPKEHAKLTVTDEKGNDLEKLPEVKDADGNTIPIDGIGTAKEEEVILVIAEVDEGYKVTVYGSDGTAKPLTTEDGKTWTMTVPKGGGVFIWADVEKKTFTVAFYSDEEELQSGLVEYGETPRYDKDKYGEPTRAGTAQYTFTWDGGWEPAIVPVTEEAVYKATFKSVTNSYDIHFVSDDGSELDKQHAAYGTTPEYSKGTPEKSPDAQYTYSFSKWDKDIVPVQGEATYKAVFTGTLRKYDVTFNPDGGTLDAPDGASSGGNYEYGTEITLPNATREDGAPFQGWSDGQNQYKAGDKISVEGALALTAMWGDPPEPDPEPDPPKPDPPKPDPEPDPEPDPDPDPNPPFVGGEEPPALPPPKAGTGMNAYDLFIQRIIEEIRNADENGTVTIDVRDTGWESLKRDIFEAAAARKDVTIVILYTHWTDDYSLTIPAGTNLSPVITTALYLETYKIGPALGITPLEYTD